MPFGSPLTADVSLENSFFFQFEPTQSGYYIFASSSTSQPNGDVVLLITHGECNPNSPANQLYAVDDGDDFVQLFDTSNPAFPYRGFPKSDAIPMTAGDKYCLTFNTWTSTDTITDGTLVISYFSSLPTPPAEVGCEVYYPVTLTGHVCEDASKWAIAPQSTSCANYCLSISKTCSTSCLQWANDRSHLCWLAESQLGVGLQGYIAKANLQSAPAFQGQRWRISENVSQVDCTWRYNYYNKICFCE